MATPAPPSRWPGPYGLPAELLAAWGLLVAVAATAAFLQLATGAFDRDLGLGWAWGWAVLGLAAAAAGTTWAGRKAITGPELAAALAIALALFGAAGLVVQIKGDRLAAQAGEPHASLPYRPVAAPGRFGTLPPAREVALTAPDGVRLQAWAYGSGRGRGIVVYPGWRGGARGFAVQTLAAWLASTFDVVLVEPRGVGASEGRQDPGAGRGADVVAAVAWLRANGDHRVGVLAEGEGALPAVLATRTLPDLDALALAAPASPWEAGEPADGALDARTWAGRLSWRLGAGVRLAAGPMAPALAGALSARPPVPLFLVDSEGDPLDPVPRLVLAARQPKGQALLPGAGHPVDWAHFDRYVDVLRAWFGRTLSPAPAAAPVVPVVPRVAAPAVRRPVVPPAGRLF